MSIVKLADPPDFSRCRLVPVRGEDGTITMSPIKEHAKLGVRALMANPFFALLDEMGAMKTAQTIIAAQFLAEQGVIDRVIVIAPHSVIRDVWFDQEIGELGKHLFISSRVTLWHGKIQQWVTDPNFILSWVITNYEFIRRDKWCEELLQYCTEKTMLVLDESTAVKNYSSHQAKMVMALRKRCGRVVLLNGTPIATSPMDMFSQGNIMSPDILECRGITKFRARYCEMGGFVVKTRWGNHPTQVIGWKNLEDLQQRFAPYVLRRLKKDCLDLPPVLPPVTLTATLTPETWKIYKQMKDNMVTWLSDTTVSVAPQAITQVMRLSQITSGFVGGIEPELYGEAQDGRPDFLPLAPSVPTNTDTVQEIGREKLDVFLEWWAEHYASDPDLKLLFWCRFIPELRRVLRELQATYPKIPLGCVAGQPLLGGKNTREERDVAIRLLHPQTAPPGPVLVGGTYGTGSLGLNFTACHTVMNISFDSSYWKLVQSEARINRPGQVHPVSPFNIVAVGPKGQKTIDHLIVKAVQDREDIAIWTTSAWVRALTSLD